ncbi:hypothetical protein D3C79_1118270 [compost metagenome]
MKRRLNAAKPLWMFMVSTFSEHSARAALVALTASLRWPIPFAPLMKPPSIAD